MSEKQKGLEDSVAETERLKKELEEVKRVSELQAIALEAITGKPDFEGVNVNGHGTPSPYDEDTDELHMKALGDAEIAALGEVYCRTWALSAKDSDYPLAFPWLQKMGLVNADCFVGYRITREGIKRYENAEGVNGSAR